MSWSLALTVSQEVSLAHFSQVLKAEHIPHRISEARGEQQVWVANEPSAEHVRALYQAFLAQPDLGFAAVNAEAVRGSRLSAASLWQQVRPFPVVLGVLLLTFAVALWTQLGESITAIAHISFNPIVFEGRDAYFLPLATSFEQGQWWRLVTPMLLHFGWLHLAMNALWFWELGRRIELHQGSWFVLLFTLISAVLSNVAQFWFSGPSLFGGLSGVLYALLGFCWIHQRVYPVPAYSLPKGVVGMMLVWLVLCLSGLVSAMGLGQIANAAHVSGLVVGCVAGALVGGLSLSRSKHSQ